MEVLKIKQKLIVRILLNLFLENIFRTDMNKKEIFWIYHYLVLFQATDLVVLAKHSMIIAMN